MTEHNVDDLIPVSGGEYMKYKSGDKKGRYITLQEFTALTLLQQACLVRSYNYITEEEKRAIREKKQATHANKTEEEKRAIREKQQATHANRTEEEKRAISERMKESNRKKWEDIKSDPVKYAALFEKRAATRERNRLAKLDPNK